MKRYSVFTFSAHLRPLKGLFFAIDALLWTDYFLMDVVQVVLH
jgi:hypothetical protein